ncbi:hypothetical protein WJX73_010295 [Symbiochloris irregularis]|uniref:Cilia- and flagella-associated protein 58 central coiled coil domain-containing protein n=1 Tax=Symbiochloris irregularis TaxID=706552 RepID=A0AAW1NZN0_9CHLO
MEDVEQKLNNGWGVNDLDAIEDHFQEVLEAMQADPGLEHFAEEYAKLLRTVKQLHDNERYLTKRCTELTKDSIESSAHVKAANVLGEEDQKTILALRNEIENAWTQLDASREKEQRARDTIAALKGELDNLSSLVETAPEREHEEHIARLMLEKEEIMQTRDNQLEQMSMLRSQADGLVERLHQAEERGQQLEVELATLHKTATHRKIEAEKAGKREEKLGRDIAQAKKSLEARTAELAQKTADIKLYEERISQTDIRLIAAQTALEKTERETAQAQEHIKGLTRSLDEATAKNEEIKADNISMASSIRQQEEGARAARMEVAKLNRTKEATIMKLKQVEQKRAETEQTRDDLKMEVARAAQSAGQLKGQADLQAAKYAELVRERDVLLKMRNKDEDTRHHQADLIRMIQGHRTNLQNEISVQKAENAKVESQVLKVQREKATLLQDAERSAQMVAETEEQLRQQAAELAEQMAAAAEGEAKLRAQEKACETMRGERNQAAKALLDAQQELDGLRRKHTLLAHQVEQQKGEAEAKDGALVKEHMERTRVEQDNDSLTNNVVGMRQELAAAHSALAARKAEVTRLSELLTETQQERLKAQKEVDVAMADYASQKAQLQRKSREVDLLYEKIRLQRANLSQGHAAYVERVKEMRLLKLHLADSLRELEVLRGNTASMESLKTEVKRLSTSLLQEQGKCRALSDELETPLNVHRWRKLEGSDPTTYELIHKVQALQKRLLATTEAVACKEAALADKQALIQQLKSTLERSPGPDASAQLSASQGELRAKQKAMKAMAAELGMCHTQVRGYQRDIAILSKQLNDAKMAVHTQKRSASAGLGSPVAHHMDLEDGSPQEEALQIKAISMTTLNSTPQLVA